MKLDQRNIVIVVLVVISLIAWGLRTTGILYIPALTAFTLAMAMGLLGIGYIPQKDKVRKIMGILITAFGLFNIVVGIMELYSFFTK